LNAVVNIALRTAKQRSDDRRRRTVALEVCNPLADVRRQDLRHAHAAERRLDVPGDVVGVVLPRPGFHLVMGQPLVLYVTLEALATTACVPDTPLQESVLRALPRAPCKLRCREGSGGTLSTLCVDVVGLIAEDAVASDAFSNEAHETHSSHEHVSQMSVITRRHCPARDAKPRANTP
jgi:hypothetical protein